MIMIQIYTQFGHSLSLLYFSFHFQDEIDWTQFGVSPYGWRQTAKMYGQFPAVLFRKKKSIWNDIIHVSSTMQYPMRRFILCTLAWILLSVFLFGFFFGLFYASNWIREPVIGSEIEKASVDAILNHTEGSVVKSHFGFGLSQWKGLSLSFF